MTKTLRLLVALAAVAAVLATTPAHAGVTSPAAVVFWSAEAQDAIVPDAGVFPGEAAVLMAIVQVAVYDAVVAIEGGSTPYAIQPSVPAGASAEVAAGAAAHGVLVGLLPGLKPGIDATFDTWYAGFPRGAARADGRSVGEQVAAGILALRQGDGRNVFVPYVQRPPGPGVFEPMPPGSQPIGTYVARIRPLVMPDPASFRPAGPPPLTSTRYATDFNEVKARGRLDGAVRTAEETAIARFWTDHGVAQWNRALIRLIQERGLTLAGAARLLALAHTSGGDAMIGCFDAKYHFGFWRPVQAIPGSLNDGNDNTQPSRSWAPLVSTPNHPEYPAAHSCHSSAVAGAIRSFFGTDVAVTIESVAAAQQGNQSVRTYPTTTAAVAQVIDARILAGVHFRFSGEDGTALGAAVAAYAASAFTSGGVGGG